MCFGIGLLSFSTHIVMVFLGFYLLRGFGQVTMGLIASTSISKWFGKHRGKLLTMASMGRSLGEGALPSLVIFLISLYGWRNAYLILAGILLTVMIPFSIYFIPKFPRAVIYSENDVVDTSGLFSLESWSWLQVFKARWPMLIMLTNAFLPFIMTGIFFQQASLVDYKGWTMELMASSFIVFSLFNVAGNFIWGPLIDRFSAKKIQPFTLIPLAIGLTILALVEKKYGAPLFMAFLGMSVGLTAMVRNTFWAEVFGIKNLGQIKGMDSSIMVIGTSLAPSFYALILDLGVSMGNIIHAAIALTIVGIFFYTLIYFHYENHSRKLFAKDF